MTCNKCGKEIDKDFKLCPYCGEPVDKPTCPKCNKELDSDFNLCPYCGENLKTTIEDTNQLSNEPERELEEEPIRERGSGFIKFIFAIAGLILIGAIIYGFASSCPSSRLDKKTPPSVRLEETLSGATVYVEAKDDYDEVKVEVEFYDTSGNLANTKTLTGRNYKKGNTYTLTISLSLSERLNYSYVRYRVKSYK